MSHPVWTIEIRNGERFAFVVDPNSRPRTRYVRTHRCALYVPCAACKAQIGTPCLAKTGDAMVEVHYIRKEVFYKRVTQELAEEAMAAKPARRLRLLKRG